MESYTYAYEIVAHTGILEILNYKSYGTLLALLGIGGSVLAGGVVFLSARADFKGQDNMAKSLWKMGRVLLGISLVYSFSLMFISMLAPINEQTMTVKQSTDETVAVNRVASSGGEQLLATLPNGHVAPVVDAVGEEQSGVMKVSYLCSSQACVAFKDKDNFTLDERVQQLLDATPGLYDKRISNLHKVD